LGQKIVTCDFWEPPMHRSRDTAQVHSAMNFVAFTMG